MWSCRTLFKFIFYRSYEVPITIIIITKKVDFKRCIILIRVYEVPLLKYNIIIYLTKSK